VNDAPYALALATGLVAAVNPCGFALLPAYLSFLVAGEEQGRVSRALTLTAAMTLGFVAVFGVFGLLTASVASAVTQRTPWLTVAIGAALVVAGAWLLAGRDLPGPRLRRGPEATRRFGSMALFGVAYALASLGCTIGPFLAVVGVAFGQASPLTAVTLFLLYAVGMAVVVGAAAVAVALAKDSLVRGLRRLAPLVNRIGGGLMLLAGLYVAWYGWYEIRLARGDEGRDPVVDGLGQVQTWVSNGLTGLGVWPVAVLLAVLVAAALLLRRRSGT